MSLLLHWQIMALNCGIETEHIRTIFGQNFIICWTVRSQGKFMADGLFVSQSVSQSVSWSWCEPHPGLMIKF